MKKSRPLAMGAALCSAILIAACSTGDADTTVEVTGTDDACTPAVDEIPAGKINFDFTNEGGDISELYVLRANGDVVAEVENVTTGTTRTLTVDLVAGEYEVRCKPGQTGEGFASDITVTGEGGAAVAEPDREIRFRSVDFEYPDLDLSDVEAGETIRFEMTNDGEQSHEFEVLDPDGEALGEVAELEVAATGGATISFGDPGTYSYQCILIDPESGESHADLGMAGTFEVT